MELALLAPLLIVLVLWANYFWEVQRARIKMAEMARFVAFERTVRQDLSGIVSEARQRYEDLDGSTKTGTLGTAFQNGITIQVQARNADAPLENVTMSKMGAQAGVGGLAGAAIGALGSTPEQLARDMGFDPSQGAVQADVQVRMVNRIIPKEIALYKTGPDGNELDLNFEEHFYLYHDTWRAWEQGDNPSQTYERVQQLTHDRVSKIVYAGVASGGGGALSSIEAVLSVLGLDFPFSEDYVRESVLMRPVPDPGYFSAAGRPTRTVPGGVLQAAYWRNDTSFCFDSCEPGAIKLKRGTDSNGGRDDNWPMRSYNCRGDFFQGANFSQAPESVYTKELLPQEYFTYGDEACRRL
ncbi:pilus assembly protein [Corallococcus aberystwythensis]|uniref:Pilus assembly protein n=1 Tax=Corallococcus aberystwythensis TaxID=2316722 RepID=A0A3A8QSY8_9BACT|nr:pilus assembly protein [Corallococcus aberystwythensis]